MSEKFFSVALSVLISFSLFATIPFQNTVVGSEASYETKNCNAPMINSVREDFAAAYMTNNMYGECQQPFALSDPEKIDFMLKNYSMLCKKGYIQDNQVRVIVLPASKKRTGLIEPLGDSDVFTLLSNLRKFNATFIDICNKLPFITLKLSYESISELSRQDFIAQIYLDTKCYVFLNESVSIIKPPEAWQQMETSYGYTINGSGTKIAILDTGIDKTHLDLDDLDDNQQTNDPKVIAERCFTDENRVADGYGHGTHCAGIAAGTGQVSNYSFVGVAPAAQLLNGKVLTDEGWGYSSWIINGIEWAVAQGACVISMSFGSDENTDEADPLSAAVNWATDQGAICVVAAGNKGSKGMFSVGTPGCASNAITVGATDKADTIAYFSSLGYTADFRVKPDVLAPGVDIISCRAVGTNMGTPISSGYTKASGTSMATPHISGLCALLLQVHPTWNPQSVKYSLLNGAVDLAYHTYEQGSGRANICNSLSMPLVTSSPISFKRIHLFEECSQNVTLRNMKETSVSAVLDAYIEILDGAQLNFISLSRKNVSLNAYQMVTIQVTVNFSQWMEGFFEGNLTITCGNAVIRVPLAVSVLSSLTLVCQDEQGREVKDLKWQLYNSTSYEQIEDTSIPSPTFFLKSGTYTVVTYGLIIYVGTEVDYNGAFLLYKNVTVPMGSDVSTNIPLNFGKKIQIQIPNPIRCYTKVMKDYGYYGLDRILQNPYVYLSNACSLTHLQKPVFGFYGPTIGTDWMSEWNVPNTLLPHFFDTYFFRWNFERVMSNLPNQLALSEADFAEYTIEISNCGKFPDHNAYVWCNLFTDRIGSGLWNGFITFPGAHWRCYVQPVEGADDLLFSRWGFALSPQIHDYSYFVLQKPVKGEKRAFKLGYAPILPQMLERNGNQIVLQYPLRGWESTQYVETGAHYGLEIFRNNNLVANESVGWQDQVYLSNYMKNFGSGQYNYRVSAMTSQNISQKNTIEYQVIYSSSKPISEQDVLPPTIDCIDCSTFQVGKIQEYWFRINDNVRVTNVSVWFKQDNGSWVECFPTNESLGLYRVNITVTNPNVQSVSLRINAVDVNGNMLTYETTPCAVKELEASLNLLYPEQCEVNDNIVVYGNLTLLSGKLPSPTYLSIFLNEEAYVVLTSYSVETGEYGGSFTFAVVVLENIFIHAVFQGFYMYPSISHEGRVSVLMHDLAILSITPAAVHAYQGDAVIITVVIQNQGNYTESFDVKLYANSSIIGSAALNLPSNVQTSLAVVWDTMNAVSGNYTLHGDITAVAEEVDISDNTCSGGTVEIVIFNVDFNSDGIVNALDLRIAAAHFLQVGKSQYDLNFDNIVDLADLEIIAANLSAEK